jgi:hypothetical protein
MFSLKDVEDYETTEKLKNDLITISEKNQKLIDEIDKQEKIVNDMLDLPVEEYNHNDFVRENKILEKKRNELKNNQFDKDKFENRFFGLLNLGMIGGGAYTIYDIIRKYRNKKNNKKNTLISSSTPEGNSSWFNRTKNWINQTIISPQQPIITPQQPIIIPQQTTISTPEQIIIPEQTTIPEPEQSNNSNWGKRLGYGALAGGLGLGLGYIGKKMYDKYKQRKAVVKLSNFQQLQQKPLFLQQQPLQPLKTLQLRQHKKINEEYKYKQKHSKSKHRKKRNHRKSNIRKNRSRSRSKSRRKRY